MSWIQKLCDVYDTMAGTEGCDLLPVGFIQKKIKFNIILTADGQFRSAEILSKDGQSFAIPSTPQAEGRTGSSGQPFPLADQLKYLVAGENDDNPRFAAYMQQLSDWCDSPDAPDCLRVLRDYLDKRTLLADLMSVPGLNLRYHKDEEAQDGNGSDASSIACFSIESVDEDNRLWMRQDVHDSWSRRASALSRENASLCYATGQLLPALETHPKLSGNAKLISAKDTGFPFQYKGRFVEDRSAATVSTLASIKAHNALHWLLDHQGFQRYGMSLVAWNIAAPALEPDESLFPDEDTEPAKKPDTFEAYAIALRDATAGYTKDLRRYMTADDLSEGAQRRMNEIVILGLQAATDGRMSITYYQELPGNLYVQRLESWATDCLWEMPGKDKPLRSPTWREIIEAAIGRDTVLVAMQDFQSKKSATKLMREMQMRLLDCIVNDRPLPHDFVQQAFRRAVQPLQFTDSKGNWNSYAWAQCVATTCALIRKAQTQANKPAASPVLDRTCSDRDYLYGRLLAVAHKLVLDTTEKDKNPSVAIRAMTRFVQSPGEAWLHLYIKLLPYLEHIGQTKKSPEGGYLAGWYLHLFGEIERQFQPQDRTDTRPLSYAFLIGFSAQLREMYQKPEDRQPAPTLDAYTPLPQRDTLFGCLLAVADISEWNAAAAEQGGKKVSPQDGQTNAMLLTASYTTHPSLTWMHIHDKLISYLERGGAAFSDRTQRLIGRIEQTFTPEDRLSNAPLNSLFLNGYLCMRYALTTKSGWNTDFWTPSPSSSPSIDSRDAAFGALLSLEHQVERRVLRQGQPEDDHPSNAMRLLQRASQRPTEATRYLLQRMKPYQNKLVFSAQIRQEAERLCQLLTDRQWNTDTPLGSDYLYTFYTYDPFKQKGTMNYVDSESQN